MTFFTRWERDPWSGAIKRFCENRLCWQHGVAWLEITGRCPNCGSKLRKRREDGLPTRRQTDYNMLP